MKDYLKLIRIKHWLKNFLVFLPLFFSTNFFNNSLLITCLISFFSFSFTSSIVYIFNDINDIEKDKKHPTKKNRPLAGGAISIKNAKVVAIVLIVLMLSTMYYLYTLTSNLLVVIVPFIYLIINFLYSKCLKNVPIVDVTIIVAGFVLRVLYGGVCSSVEVSKYLYLMIIFGSFFLGFGKRRNEILKNGDKSRKVLSMYNKEFLDKNMYVAFALAIVSYSLWCFDPTTISRIGNDYIFWTIPLLMIILQLYSLDIEGNSDGDPIEVILSDKKLLSTGIVYILVLILILYVL